MVQGFYIRGANPTEDLAASQQVIVFVEADLCCSVWKNGKRNEWLESFFSMMMKLGHLYVFVNF